MSEFPSRQNAAVLPPMKILIVDDDKASRMLLKSFLTKRAHTVVEAADGSEAIAVFKQELPDMVLMDISMPVMTGYEAAGIIKHLCGDHFVPVIFLTSHNDEASLAQCVASGGDDFYVKPFQSVLLEAKIVSWQRNLQMHKELELYRQRTEQEIALTQHVFDALTRRMGDMPVPELDCWLRPAGHFSGDLLIYNKSPQGKLYLLLGDFTGHGFSAAIGALPTSDIFFALTQRDFSLAEVMAEINRKLYEIMPTGKFCAATLICHDPARRQTEIFNGGLPPVLILDATGAISGTVESSNVSLGILREEKFTPNIEQLEARQGDTLLIYSDGVVEARNHAGEFFEVAGLRAALGTEANDPLNSVRQALEQFVADVELDDDVSMIALRL